jgi:hypothetical protein
VQHGREGPLPHFVLEDARGVSSASRVWITSGSFVARAAAMWVRKPWRLRVARRVVVVIVEAGFADRHDLGMLRARDQVVGRDVELLMGVMRMRADRAGHVGKALRDRQHLRMTLHAGRDRHHAADAGRLPHAP